MRDPLSKYPGYLLRRASVHAMAALAKRLTALDLRPTEATVLAVIGANANATQSDIGRLLDIATANMAPLVARLEDRSLIERKPVNGRSHSLSLTARGKELAVRITKIMNEHEQVLVAGIPVALRPQLMAALRKLASGPVD
jgi:DNA-binding MarR family transcriptional regulator